LISKNYNIRHIRGFLTVFLDIVIV